MNCVYNAFANHMAYLNEPKYEKVYNEFRIRKEITHENSLLVYTFSGVVPWLYWHMLLVHNALSRNRVEMRIERSYISLMEIFEEATDAQKMIMHNTKYIGNFVDKITIAPAVYCLLNEQHAEFGRGIPVEKGKRIIMAIRLMKNGEE